MFYQRLTFSCVSIISKKDKRAFAGNGKNTQSDTYQTKSGEKWRRLELSRLEDALEKSMLVDIKL